MLVLSLRRILVCAPSNAAIDEIVKRLTADPESGGGIFDGNGQRFSPSVRHSHGFKLLPSLYVEFELASHSLDLLFLC